MSDQTGPKEYIYLAAVILDDGEEVVLDLEERGWAEPTRLARVKRFTLVPKDDAAHMPVVSVQIPDDCKPVFKTRVFGVIGMSGESQNVMRCYAVGYHCVGGSETLTWILPNGCIEVGPDPLLASSLFKHLRSQM